MIAHIDLSTTFLNTERNDVTQIFLRYQNMRFHDRLADLINIIGRRQITGVVDHNRFAVLFQHLIDYRRCRGDQVQIIFAL